MSILIKNADVFGHAKDILIEGDRIAKIGSLNGAKAGRVIDATGLCALPAFVDIHTHLREPGFEGKETIATGLAAAVAGGFSAVCPMPNTNPVIDNKYLVYYIKSKAEAQKLAKVYPIGCITKGQRGESLAEMGRMQEEGAVAFSDDGRPVSDARVMRLALEYAKPIGAVLISHCEDMSLADGGFVNEGASSLTAGLKGLTRAAEEVMIARDVILAETLDANVHIAHVSTLGGARIIREAKKRGVKVTAETCPHYIALTDDCVTGFDTATKVNPPIRTENDRKAIIKALADGTIDCIATDHAPHGIMEKSVPYAEAAFGISGLETAYAVCYTELVKGGKLTLKELSALMTDNPASVVKIPCGKLEEGGLADIVLVDNAAEYTVDSARFKSKGKFTPFNGKKLCGKIKYTLVDGKVAFSDKA